MLIIKCRNFISAEALNEVKHRIEEQAKEGTIVLPYYLDAIYVPDDTEIVFEDKARAKEKEKMTNKEKLQQAITGLKFMKHGVHENSATYYWYDMAIRSLEAWDKVTEEICKLHDNDDVYWNGVYDCLEIISIWFSGSYCSWAERRQDGD